MVGFYVGFGKNETHQSSIILSRLFYLVPMAAVYVSNLLLKCKVSSFLGLPYYHSSEQLRDRYWNIVHFYMNPNAVDHNQLSTMEIFNTFVKQAFQSLKR